MVVKLIFTVLLLFMGVICAVSIPFFGVKFCRESKYPHGEDLDSKTTFKDLFNEFPLWIWIISLLVFLGFITGILNLWCPSLLPNSVWSLSRFVGFFALFFYIILVNVTDDYGKIKWFGKRKKSK